MSKMTREIIKKGLRKALQKASLFVYLDGDDEKAIKDAIELLQEVPSVDLKCIRLDPPPSRVNKEYIQGHIDGAKSVIRQIHKLIGGE
ncbi:MAG: hypothetical protein ABFC84_16785 [Veillonellales bacterium]